MLIIGAKGFAKQLIDVIDQLGQLGQIALFDDVSDPPLAAVYNVLPVLHSEQEAVERFRTIDKRFVLGIGRPLLRSKMAERFTQLGGTLESVLSPKAQVSRFVRSIGSGTTILSGAVIEGDVLLGKATLINVGAVVTHDSVIGDFVEVCPGATVCGTCSVGSFTSIGAGAVLIPNIQVGQNVVIAAGSVVTKNIPDNVMVAGVPAVIKKKVG